MFIVTCSFSVYVMLFVFIVMFGLVSAVVMFIVFVIVDWLYCIVMLYVPFGSLSGNCIVPFTVFILYCVLLNVMFT